MRRLAYIPARSGSKGIPKKNIHPLFGRPLLGWIVEAAKKTGLFDRIMVSTDSDEFAMVARSCGAWVPFLRLPEYAQDETSTIDAICSDKVRIEEIEGSFDVFCLLQPTSPLCRSSDIIGAMKLYEKVHEGVVSVSEVDSRYSLLRLVDSDHRSMPLVNNTAVLRRQDEQKKLFQLNGAIYINSWDEIDKGLRMALNPYAYVMPSEYSIDIDTFDDLAQAEKIMRTINYAV